VAGALPAGRRQAAGADDALETERLHKVFLGGENRRQHLEYRPDVDGLRALAVCAVIAYHMRREWLPGGFVGVDIFFVISGFVVSGSLLRKQSPSVGDFFIGFYARRAKRLAPALSLMVLGTSLGLLLLPEAGDYIDYYLMTAQLALVGGANIAFASQSTSYFELGANGMKTEYNPLTHTWSLGVEEQFYFVFPLCVLAAYGVRATATVMECPPCAGRPLLLLGSAAALSLAASAWMSHDEEFQTFAFYMLPSRFWQLVAGAILFEMSTRGWPSWALVAEGPARSAAWLLCELLVLAALLGGLARTSPEDGFPVPGSLPAIFGAMGFIAMGCVPPSVYIGRVPRPALNAALGWAPIAYIGRISYPLYLWHWPIFVYCRWTYGLEDWVVRVSAVAATVALAAASYHVVEGRVRSWRPRRRWHIFAAVALTIGSLELWLALLRGGMYAPLSNALLRVPTLEPVEHSSPPPPFVRRFSPPPPSTFPEQQSSLAGPSPPANATWLPAPIAASPRPANASRLPAPMAASPPPSPPEVPGWACRNPATGSSHLPLDPPSVNPMADRLCWDENSCVSASDDDCRLIGLTDECFFLKRGETPIAPLFDYRWFNETNVGQCIQPHRRNGAGATMPAVFLMGDSYTSSIKRAAEIVCEEAEYALVHVGMSCCPWGQRNIPGEYGPHAKCMCQDGLDIHQDYVFDLLAQKIQPGDIVLSIAHDNVHVRANAMDWLRDVAIPFIESKGATLILAVAWPMQSPMCSRVPSNPSCRLPDSVVSGARERVNMLAEEHESVYGVDLSAPFCSNGRCTPFMLGSSHMGYTDDGVHLSGFSTNIMASFLGQSLRDQGVL
jgi:peptidoglycan/LPS O-acetylase OafA/YrhL